MPVMRVALCIISTLAATASLDSALDGLSLVQLTAQLRSPESQRIVAASDGEEAGITDVIAHVKEAWNNTDEKLFTLISKTTTSAAQACSLLLFVPVGSNFQQTGPLLKENLDHLHSTVEGYCDVTVFLNHYEGDEDQENWKKQTNMWEEDWYKRNVQWSTAVPGFKFQVMQDVLGRVDLSSFTWVWPVDEDFNIKHTDVKRALQLKEQSGALISIPAFTQVGSNEKERKLSFPMQGPTPDCLYRYADLVEVIFPIFRTKALEIILWDCDRCIGEKIVWGLNRMWCSYTARKLGHDRSTACAIIDGAPMVHQNFRTLKTKYEDRAITKAFEEEAFAWMADVQKRYPEDFVAGNATWMKSTKCVKA